MFRCDDDTHTRLVDRIRATAFKECRDAYEKQLKNPGGPDPNLFSRSWVARRINRSETFVKVNWNRDPYEVKDQKRNGRPLVLSQQSVEIIEDMSRKKKAGNSRVALEILKQRGKVVDRRLVNVYRGRMGLKPFHEIRKPKISKKNVEDRLWFANYMSNWTEDDFLNFACSDEFYLYTNRKPNSKNDIIWARSVEEIPDEERFRMVGAHPACFGIFICFTAVKVLWVAKETGQSWDGEYFRQVLAENVIPFLKDPQSVVDTDSVVFLHDRAPCMSALATQALLKESNIDFLDNTMWPGNSPDLNPTENLGSCIKERVETRMLADKTESLLDMKEIFKSVIADINNDTTILQTLLRSMRTRLDAVILAEGGPTRY
jgi:hypothetical protein